MAVRTMARSSGRRAGGLQFWMGTGFICLSLVFAVSVLAKKSEPPAKQAPTIVAEYDPISVPVPVEPVPAGTRVRDIQLKMIAFPRHQLPEGALQSLASYQDAVTTAVLPAGLPFFKDNLSMAARHNNPVLEQIPPGMRAITLRVDATSSVEGWAGSGSIVDVLLVEKDRSSVIAEHVKVLSAERVVAPVEGAAAPQVPSTVTLLVTQEQALAISTAVPRGRIAFALRSLSDEEAWIDKSFSAERLHGKRVGRSGVIRGYASVRTAEGERRFALADGSWVASEVVPRGFLPARKD